MIDSALNVSTSTRRILSELADETGQAPSQIIELAVEAYRRQWILDRTNAAYAALRNDPEGWQDLLEERADWAIGRRCGREDDVLGRSYVVSVRLAGDVTEQHLEDLITAWPDPDGID